MSKKETFLTLFKDFAQKAEPLLIKLSEVRKTTIFPLLFHLQVSIAPWCISKVYDALLDLNEKERRNIDVIIFSTGGDADTAFHIGRMLHRSTKEKLTFIIPRIAASAATLLTFAGDELLMSSASELGPIDPQIEVAPERYISARSLRETIELFLEKIVNSPNVSKSTVEAFLEKLPLLEVVDYQRLLNHTQMLATNLLNLRMIKNNEKAQKIAEVFVKGFEYHGKAITIDECVKLGLQIREMSGEDSNIIWEFSKLWEELAIVRAKPGSKIIALKLGKGVAFIPTEIEESHEIQKSSIEALMDKLIKTT